jgi:hypothetical protein
MCLFEAGYKSEAEAGEALADAIKTGLVKSEAEAGEALADAIKTGLVKREGGSFFLLPPRFTLNIDVFLAHFLEEKKRICGSRAHMQFLVG